LTESESVYHDITIYTTTANILDSSVASPKILGGAEYIDFERATVYCLGHRLSQHKSTSYARNLWDTPLSPCLYAYAPRHPWSDLS